MEADLNTVVEAINGLSTILTDHKAYIEQYMLKLDMFIAFQTTLMIIIVFLLIRRRGHKKIM